MIPSSFDSGTPIENDNPGDGSEWYGDADDDCELEIEIENEPPGAEQTGDSEYGGADNCDNDSSGKGGSGGRGRDVVRLIVGVTIGVDCQNCGWLRVRLESDAGPGVQFDMS